MNGVELYLLSRKLMTIAIEAMPTDTELGETTPATRLVLGDVIQNQGTTADLIAGRTGLRPGQVSALISDLTAAGLLENDDQGIRLSMNRPLGGTAFPSIETALARELTEPGDEAEAAAEIAAQLETVARRLGTGTILRAPGDFNAAYSGTPPWDIGRPQPALAEVSGSFTGRVLDVGCGTGEHALLAASLGLEAQGVDAAPAAIEAARRKAAERKLPARFELHDALDLPSLGERFDTVIDSTLFHVFSDDERTKYEASLRAVIPPGGRYFMLCFSDRQPGGFGPRRVSEAEIRETFGDGWRIDAIEPVTLEVTMDPAGVRAWLVSTTRV